MVFNLCYGDKTNVLLVIELFPMINEKLDYCDNKWYIEIKSKFKLFGLTKFIYDNIKTDTDLNLLQNKFCEFEELRGWIHTNKQFNYNKFTTKEQIIDRYDLIIKIIKQKLNGLCEFYKEFNLIINED